MGLGSHPSKSALRDLIPLGRPHLLKFPNSKTAPRRTQVFKHMSHGGLFIVKLYQCPEVRAVSHLRRTPLAGSEQGQLRRKEAASAEVRGAKGAETYWVGEEEWGGASEPSKDRHYLGNNILEAAIYQSLLLQYMEVGSCLKGVPKVGGAMDDPSSAPFSASQL